MRELNMKFNWLYSCADASDEYDVVLSEQCTVREFVEYALSKRGDNFRVVFWRTGEYAKPVCEFKNGTAQYTDAMERYGDAVIGRIRANGGYGHMHYTFRLKEDDK